MNLYRNFPIKKYDIIVIDPPYNLSKMKRKVRNNQKGFDYKTLSLEDIMKLPIEQISHKNSWCFL